MGTHPLLDGRATRIFSSHQLSRHQRFGPATQKLQECLARLPHASTTSSLVRLCSAIFLKPEPVCPTVRCTSEYTPPTGQRLGSALKYPRRMNASEKGPAQSKTVLKEKTGDSRHQALPFSDNGSW